MQFWGRISGDNLLMGENIGSPWRIYIPDRMAQGQFESKIKFDKIAVNGLTLIIRSWVSFGNVALPTNSDLPNQSNHNGTHTYDPSFDSVWTFYFDSKFLIQNY